MKLRCPRTGKLFPSGITAKGGSLQVSNYSTRCPYCWGFSHTYSGADFLPDAGDVPRPWWKLWGR